MRCHSRSLSRETTVQTVGERGWGRGQPGRPWLRHSPAQSLRLGSREIAKLERGFSSRGPPGSGPQNFDPMDFKEKEEASWGGERRQQNTVSCKIQPADAGPGGRGWEHTHSPPCSPHQSRSRRPPAALCLPAVDKHPGSWVRERGPRPRKLKRCVPQSWWVTESTLQSMTPGPLSRALHPCKAPQAQGGGETRVLPTCPHPILPL